MSSESNPEAGFSAPTVEELQPLFDNYKIESLIAVGGMGAVYRAVQTSLDREVAIKILPRELGEDEQFQKSFTEEAKAMAKLIHPNLVAVFDFGSAGGLLFLAMEFVEGRSLHDAAEGNAIDQVEAAQTIQLVCDGLAHAHGKGIIHRDIKPANILIDQEGMPKVTDFGLAGPMNERGNGVLMGTPYYTAPEVYEREGAVDQRADVYSVCVMLYELLTGQLPKDGYQMPSKINDSHPAFDDIIKRGLHPNPGFRISTAHELKELLNSVVSQIEGGKAPEVTEPTKRLKAGAVLKIQGQKSLPKQAKPTVIKKPPVPSRAPAAVKRATVSKPAPVVPSSSGNNPAVIVISLLAVVGIIGAIFAFSGGKEPEQSTTETPAETSKPSAEKSSDGAPDTSPKLKDGKARFGSTIKVDKPTRKVQDIKNHLLTNQMKIQFGDREVLPEETISVGDRYFLLIEEKMTWFEALAFCEDLGAQLACFHGEADFDWAVSSELKELTGDKLFWTGGYAAGEADNFAWIDGAEWDLKSYFIGKAPTANSKFLALSASKRRLAPFAGDLKLPFIMEWTSEREAKGSFKKQLERTRDAIAAGETPQWPAGSVIAEDRCFVCIPKRVSWQSARIQSRNYEGELAVIDSAPKLDAVAECIRLHLNQTDVVWTGGKFTLGKGWAWHNGIDWDFTKWAPGEPARLKVESIALQLIADDDLMTSYSFKAGNAKSPAGAYLISWATE